MGNPSSIAGDGIVVPGGPPGPIANDPSIAVYRGDEPVVAFRASYATEGIYVRRFHSTAPAEWGKMASKTGDDRIWDLIDAGNPPFGIGIATAPETVAEFAAVVWEDNDEANPVRRQIYMKRYDIANSDWDTFPNAWTGEMSNSARSSLGGISNLPSGARAPSVAVGYQDQTPANGQKVCITYVANAQNAGIDDEIYVVCHDI